LQYRVIGLTPMVVGLSQSLAQQSVTVSRTSSGTRQSALTLSDVYWRRICLRDTSACSALEVDNLIALYKSTYLLTYLQRETSGSTGELGDDLVPVVEALATRLAVRQVARRAAVTLVTFHAANARLTLALTRSTIALLCGSALTVAVARCSHNETGASFTAATTEAIVESRLRPRYANHSMCTYRCYYRARFCREIDAV